MARSYHPKNLDSIQNNWKMALNEISPAAAKSLGDRNSHPNAFPHLSLSSTNENNNSILTTINENKDNNNNNNNNNEASGNNVDHKAQVNTNETIEPKEVSKEVIINDGNDDDDDDDDDDDGQEDIDGIDEIDDISVPSGLDEDAENDDVNLDDDDLDFEFS